MREFSKIEIEAIGNAIIEAENGNAQAARSINKLIGRIRADGRATRKAREAAEAKAKLDRMLAARGLK